MLLTTKQAEEKACCVDVRATCAHERCMAWRWAEKAAFGNFYRCVNRQATEEPPRPIQVPIEAKWVPYDEADMTSRAGWLLTPEEERSGFCGRAGKPEFES